MKRIIKWTDEHLEETVLIVLLTAISCVMLLQVFMRKVFNDSLSWPEEFCRYCYVWSAFFSLSYATRQGNLLRVAVVMDLLPMTVRKVMAIFVNVVSVVVFSVFFVYSIDVVKTLKMINQSSTAMGWPMYLVYLCTVLGFAFAAVRTVQVIYRQIRGFNALKISAIESMKEDAETEVSIAKTDLNKSAGK